VKEKPKVSVAGTKTPMPAPGNDDHELQASSRSYGISPESPNLHTHTQPYSE
jgi:hypothetical protein